MEKPVLSIITIVYNNVKHVERTLLSVIGQTYSSIQYIVIDGASTDGTLQILLQNKGKIDVLVSEPDNGIYDAMNKGLKLATGDYVLFMNSGDEIYCSQTVEKVFSSFANADIYYGETEMLDENLQSQGQRRHQAPHQLDKNSFRFGMSVSHQAIYVKRSIAKFYDIHYHLSADIDWILDAIWKSETIINTKMYVAKYMMGGMSKAHHRKSLMERYQIFRKYYGLVPNLINHGVIAYNLAAFWLKNRKTND